MSDSRHLQTSWLPPCSMARVITHWTAGSWTCSSLDRQHYHILIDGDGVLVRGWHPISANAGKLTSGSYAAHTRGCNTGSIGVAICGMAGAEERPFDFGQFPMREFQWRLMAEVVAELCLAYSIPVTPRTVLGHGEVQRNLGIKQAGKWDPMVLPWEPELSPAEVGRNFRGLVEIHRDRLRAERGAA